jgi:hypothetical protein
MSSVLPPPMSIQQWCTPADRELGLVSGGYNIKLNTCLAFHALNKSRAIFRGSACFGRDGTGAGNAATLHLFRADFERCQGAVHRFLTQPSIGGQALTQTHNAGIGVDDAESLAASLGHKQAAVIGAQINRGIDLRFP